MGDPADESPGARPFAHWLAWQTLATPAAPMSVLLVTGLALTTVGATATTWYGPVASAARRGRWWLRIAQPASTLTSA